MRCPHCEAENPGGARYCLNCGTPLTQHCSHCQTELPLGARFCTNCGQPVRPSTPVDDARLIRLTAATPAPLAQKVRAATDLAGERRTVTALFLDVVGATMLADQVDPEDWTILMNCAFDRFYPAIYHYEGTIARLMGDALLAFFGAPLAHEDDPVRAVHSALDLLDLAGEYAQEVWQRYGVEFAVRIGLSTGPVIVGPIGSDLRYEYTPMGGAINLADRIQEAARPMTALISENTYRFVAPLFEVADAGWIEVKGRAEPMRAYEVLGAKARPGQVRGLSGLQSPMVGRDAELAALLQLCEAVRAGLGRAALVIGEPGLGKTRLIAEWKATVEAGYADSVSEGPQWVEAHCLSYGQALAYQLVIDLLRSLISVPEAAEEPEVHAALLAVTEELFGEEAIGVYPYLGHLLLLKLEGEALEQVRPLDPQAFQTQYLVALRKLLQAKASRQPLVLILEDLHWADPSSTELFVKLLPLVSSVPVLLCLVTRPEREAPGWKLVTAAREVMGGSLTEITLNTLSEGDSRQLVANLLEIEELPEEMRTLILRKAEGNPFFVEELIRMLIDQGAIVRRNKGWVAGAEIEKVEIPDTLEGLLMARIDRLPEEAKHILRVASVIGRQFPVKVLEYVLRRGPTP
jgi:class 3 adenylate cyclase